MGRGHDVRRLGDELAAAADGHGSATLIVGESGIGKTALAAEIARMAESSGAATIWIGHRAAADLSPSWTWNQVLRELAGRTEEHPVHQGAPPADGDRRMAEAMAAAVAALVREPTVLVLDDVHLAETAERATRLAVLTGALRRLPLLVLATWQHGDPARPGLELSRLLAGADLRSVWLHGLDAERTAELVEHLSGVAPTGAVADQLVARTGGNPLYLTELTRLLMERRRLDGVTAALSDDGVPPAVTGIIAGRMAALPPDTASALNAAAALGSKMWCGPASARCSASRRTSWRTGWRRRSARYWWCPNSPAATGSATASSGTPSSAGSTPVPAAGCTPTSPGCCSPTQAHSTRTPSREPTTPGGRESGWTPPPR